MVAIEAAGYGRRNVAWLLADLDCACWAGVVARQGVGTAEMEGAAGFGGGDCSRRAVGELLGSDGAVGAHLTSGDAEGFVAEHVGCENVQDAEDDDDDAAGDDDLPGGGAEGFLRGGYFVEVAEYGDAEDDHSSAEGNKAGARGEEGPRAGDVGAEKGQFRDDEGHC